MVWSGVNLSLSRRSCGLYPGGVLRRSRIVIAEASKDSPREPILLNREDVIKVGTCLLSQIAGLSLFAGDAEALPGFKKDLNKSRRSRENVDPDLFQDGPDGLKYYDVIVGDGAEAKLGSRVVVHFDAKWRGITFVTSRQGMGVAGGSPLGFDVGAAPGAGGTLKGLDLGVRGMRVGGQRKLLVPSKLAYGQKGYGEIPPGADLTIDVQLLSIKLNAIGTQVKLVEG
eukprot:jgi/Picsp_1/1828/NSC_05295-R1_peptidyl-prolyl cis-trans fkbp-type